ncbi:MAG: glycosyltransferase family 2 protein [Duncaniella sp.]|nr:glycosyltransferase family 2 protein [Duncaniella sp.]
MKISAVLLNYNSAADCAKCVSFLQKQEGVEIDIIIVDNASRADDLVRIKALCARENLRLIANANNCGYNAGNNLGLRLAAELGYDYALIANPDMEFPDPRYAARLVGELEANPMTVAVGSDIVTPEGIHQNPMGSDGSWASSFGWIRGFFCRKKPAEAYDFVDDHRSNHICDKLSGCALMVNLRHLARLGFFDEYPFLYCEEAIFARQAEAAGMQMRYVADVRAIHRHIPSTKGDPRPRFRQWRRSRLYFIRRYSGYPWYGRLLASLSWSTYLGLMIFLSTLKQKL